MSDEKKVSDFFSDFIVTNDKQRAARDAAIEWARGVLNNEPSGLVLMSSGYGAGKTHLARACHAVFNYLNDPNLAGTFITAPDFISEIKSTYDQNSKVNDAALFRNWRSGRYMIIDDFGKQYSRELSWEQEQWFRLVDGLSKKSLLFTSNLTAGQLAEKIGGASASRLGGMCNFIDLTGLPDYRLAKKEIKK